MIGRFTADLEPWPRRWLFHLLGGCPDVGTRQKWRALWPHLATLPTTPLTILDAGCGNGRWTLELAALRPQWRIIGMDRTATCLREADAARRHLGVRNAAFIRGDFEAFPCRAAFDVVLSVTSAHYLATLGRGPQLFAQFRSWLRPGGRLLALIPRRREETPFVPWLPRPEWHPVFSAADVRELCDGAGLDVELLRATVGRPGVLARQLGWYREGHPRLLAASYPVERLLTFVDVARPPTERDPALLWTLIARPA
jgi:SAM-dependent methyltransferase